MFKDEYEICEDFADYLHRRHPSSAWHILADRLLARLNGMKDVKETTDFRRNYTRDRFSDWAIHALERSGRKDEIIPLCEAEAKRTNSYERLVECLIVLKRYEDAERRIQEGVRATRGKWPGIAAGLRNRLREIRTLEKNWPVIAAMQVEEFVRHPSWQVFTECEKDCEKVKVWSNVRESLLCYLEKGELPWKQKGWPLPESGLDRPDANRRNRFPLVDTLIGIAIAEKKPDQVLRWYDQRPKDRFGWYGVDEDTIATAVQTHAPDRAVAMWKNKAEQLIAQVKPSAYQDAAKYLRKAGAVMTLEKKAAEWEHYLKALRTVHARKRRLMEILDGLEGKPIIKGRR